MSVKIRKKRGKLYLFNGRSIWRFLNYWCDFSANAQKRQNFCRPFVDNKNSDFFSLLALYSTKIINPIYNYTSGQ